MSNAVSSQGLSKFLQKLLQEDEELHVSLQGADDVCVLLFQEKVIRTTAATSKGVGSHLWKMAASIGRCFPSFQRQGASAQNNVSEVANPAPVASASTAFVAPISIDPSEANGLIAITNREAESSVAELPELDEFTDIINNKEENHVVLHNQKLQEILARKDIAPAILERAARRFFENQRKTLAAEITRDQVPNRGPSPRLSGGGVIVISKPTCQLTDGTYRIDMEKHRKKRLATNREQVEKFESMLKGSGEYAGREMYQIYEHMYGNLGSLQEKYRIQVQIDRQRAVNKALDEANQTLCRANQTLCRANRSLNASNTVLAAQIENLVVDRHNFPLHNTENITNARNNASKESIKNTRSIANNNIETINNNKRILENEIKRGEETPQSTREKFEEFEKSLDKNRKILAECEHMLQKDMRSMYDSYTHLSILASQ